MLTWRKPRYSFLLTRCLRFHQHTKKPPRKLLKIQTCPSESYIPRWPKPRPHRPFSVCLFCISMLKSKNMCLRKIMDKSRILYLTFVIFLVAHRRWQCMRWGMLKSASVARLLFSIQIEDNKFLAIFKVSRFLWWWRC